MKSEKQRKHLVKLAILRRGTHHSEESKKKMSEIKKRLFAEGRLIQWSKGKHFSAEEYPNKGMRGKHHSLKSIQKMSEMHKGLPSYWKRKHRSEETKEKISLKLIGNPAWNKNIRDIHLSPQTEFKKGRHPSTSTEFKKGQIPWNRDKPYLQIRGSKHHNWKGGITPFRIALHNSLEYQRWRKTTFERDNYTCQKCGQRGIKLGVHHIKPFAQFPELRLDINNGITLCKDCHNQTKRGVGLCVV
ncbi:MAG: HNH endonuclease [Candidatus Micrarchaeota archaeon]|nr:HNH endonuclease [Candidatus Micrarchaeota archaeon]